MDRQRRADRWTRRCCDVAVRVATVSAALCPTLSSVGASVVAALLGLCCAAAQRGSFGRAAAQGCYFTRHRGSYDEAVMKSPCRPQHARAAGKGCSSSRLTCDERQSIMQISEDPVTTASVQECVGSPWPRAPHRRPS
jgi:hypothetical protein